MDDEGNTTKESSDQKVLEGCQAFYQKLFTAKENNVTLQDEFLTQFTARVSAESQAILNTLITLEELYQALLAMPPGKSPGQDGLTKAFYIRFWRLLGPDLLRVIQYAHTQGNLPETQRNAIISLLFKIGDPADLANWRAISLLNLDYKILTKTLANRLKRVLPDIGE